jgi:hypothetical protein
MVRSTLGRLIVVPIAFVFAALTATVVLLTLGLERVTRAARIGQTDSLGLPAAAVWQVFATAGFIGGLVYWLLAGRRA